VAAFYAELGHFRASSKNALLPQLSSKGRETADEVLQVRFVDTTVSKCMVSANEFDEFIVGYLRLHAVRSVGRADAQAGQAGTVSVLNPLFVYYYVY
jgi:hypothetical protein